MQKRGLISFYIIIAVVMLAAFGYGFYYLIHSGDGNRDFTISKSMSLDAQKDVVSNNIQDCLEKRSKEAIDYYGIKDSSEGLIMKYIDTTMDSCVDYSYFKRKGLDVERGKAQSYVEVFDDAILITLNYAVYIHNDDGTARLDRFEYNIKRVVSGTVNPDTQLVENEIVLISEDGDAELTIPQGTIVQGLSSDGRISVKMLDKNFDGLQNGVVVGKVVYEGLPDGAKFDPAIQITIKIKKGDVPVQYDASVLKIAWYDEQNGLWRTYRQSGFHEDDYYYYYSAEVDHFTSMAVVACGTEETSFHLRMYYAYLSPVQPKEGEDASVAPTPLVWVDNKDDDNIKYLELTKENQENAHCLFLDTLDVPQATGAAGPSAYTETTASWGSEVVSGIELPLPTGRIYSVEREKVFPADKEPFEKCQFMIDDWDRDDQQGKDFAEVTTAVAPRNKKLTITVTPKDSSVTVPAGGQESCWNTCKGIAQGKVSEFLQKQQDIELVPLIAPADFIKVFITGPTTRDDPDIQDDPKTGDGLKDGATITCTFEGGDSYTCTSPQGSDEINDWSFFTSNGVYATPRVYGYTLTKDVSSGYEIPVQKPYVVDSAGQRMTEYVGGYGEFKFVLQRDGNACSDGPKEEIENIDASLSSPDIIVTDPATTCPSQAGGGTPDGGICFGEPIANFEKDKTLNIEVGDGVSCSLGDKCIWTLNNPTPAGGFISEYDNTKEFPVTLGKLRMGSNIVGVWVKNKGETGDADAYANAVLVLTGTGVMGQEDCETNIQDRINYLCGCTGNCNWNGPAGDELNCLTGKGNRDKNDYSTHRISLCDIKKTPSCGEFSYAEGETVGGICALCPTVVVDAKKGTRAEAKVSTWTTDGWKENQPIPEITKGSQERCKICPGRMDTADNGCLCGNKVFDIALLGSDTAAYCCGGEILTESQVPEGGCWQTSPLALKPAVVPNQLGELELGTQCYLDGDALGICPEGASCCIKTSGGSTLTTCLTSCGNDDDCKNNCYIADYSIIDDTEYKCTADANCNPVFTEETPNLPCTADTPADTPCMCGGDEGTLKAADKYCCLSNSEVVESQEYCPEEPGTIENQDPCARVGTCMSSDACNNNIFQELSSGSSPCISPYKCCVSKSSSEEACCTHAETSEFMTIKACLAISGATFDPYIDSANCGLVAGGCPAGPLTNDANSGLLADGTRKCKCSGTEWDPAKAAGDHKYCCSTGFSKDPCPGAGDECGDGNRCDMSAPFCCTDSAGEQVPSCQATCVSPNIQLDGGLAPCPAGSLASVLAGGKSCWCDEKVESGYCCLQTDGSYKGQSASCPGEGGTIQPGDPCAGGLGECKFIAAGLYTHLLTNNKECVSGTNCYASDSGYSKLICCKVGEQEQKVSLSVCDSDPANILISADPNDCEGSTTACCSYNGKNYCKIDGVAIDSADDCDEIETNLESYLGEVEVNPTYDCTPNNCLTFTPFDNDDIPMDMYSCDGDIVGLPAEKYPYGWRICVGDTVKSCSTNNQWITYTRDGSCDPDYDYYCLDYGDGRAFCSYRSPYEEQWSQLPLGVCPLYNGDKDWHLGEKDYGCSCGEGWVFANGMGTNYHCCYIDADCKIGPTKDRGDCNTANVCIFSILSDICEKVGDCANGNWDNKHFRCGADKKFHYDLTCPE